MFNIDKMSRVPIYSQVIEQFERAVMSGEYSAGMQLPSVRELAVRLSINPNTLQKAYAELERRGLCTSVPGSGRFVAAGAGAKLRDMKRGLLSDVERIAAELRLSGIPEDDVIDAVRSAYGGGDGHGKGGSEA